MQPILKLLYFEPGLRQARLRILHLKNCLSFSVFVETRSLETNHTLIIAGPIIQQVKLLCYLVLEKQIPDASEQLIDSRITKIPARSSSEPTLLSSVCRQESYFVTTGGIAAFCVLFGAAFQTQHFPPVSQVYTGLHIISSDPGAQIGDMWRL